MVRTTHLTQNGEKYTFDKWDISLRNASLLNTREKCKPMETAYVDYRAE